MASTSTQSTVSKLIGTAIALVGAIAAKKAVSFLWKAASGHQPPDGDDTSASLREAAAAAVVTGALIALVRVLAARGTMRALT